jgi:glucose 1-dehydrogenase
MNRMKAVAVFPARREVRLIDCEAPHISAPSQVKVRMLEVGICGTDKDICAFQYGTPPPNSDSLIIGHESLAQVVEVGSPAIQLKPGGLVVLSVRRPCPHAECVACRADRQDFCYTGDFTERGIKGHHGFMTEFVVDQEKYMVPVPQGLRDVGVLVEPLTIAEKSIRQVWQVQQRLPWGHPGDASKTHSFQHRAVVLGAGPVGLLGAMVLILNGFLTYVYSRGAEGSAKADFTRAIGATYVSSQKHSPEQLSRLVGNIDLVYEATGASQFAFQALAVLGTNGIFVFTGVPGRREPIQFDADRIMQNLVLKNQVVFGSVNADRHAFEDAIRDLGIFLQRWPEAVRSLITSRHAVEAYRDVLIGKPVGIKNLITFGGRNQ